MKTYQYSETVISQLKIERGAMLFEIIPLCAFILVIGIFSPVIMDIFDMQNFLDGDASTVCLVVGIISFILALVYYWKKMWKSIAISENLKKHKLIINGFIISGCYCEDVKTPDSSKYFKIKVDEIINIEKRNPKASANEYFTFVIYTKSDTYKLCIDAPENAYKDIHDLHRLYYNSI